MVRTSLVARLLGVRLLTVEGTVVLAPVSFGHAPLVTPPDVATTSKGIGARLGPTARLIDESINDLHALD